MDNKIHWHEWGKKTFEKSQKEGKPVLLNITAVWCHWCHQMRDDCYLDSEIAETINKDFIPIKVDTDKRPDINQRYNQGGWPTTVFLTPEGRIIGGGTYFPPNDFKILLFRIAEFYKKNKTTIEREKTNFPLIKEGLSKEEKLDTKIIDNILDALVVNFDFDCGGFGFQPKFPFPEGIEFFLLKNYKTNDSKLLKMVSINLAGMKGIEDKTEGGFFRYSVTRDWSVPHYEKMLELNAGIIKNYLHAFLLTKDKKWKDTALKTLEYVKNNLTRPGGGFYGSQDADEEYYQKKERAGLKKPYIDKTVYTDSSAKMASAYLDAYLILNDMYYLETALKTIEFLLENLIDKFMYHYFDTEKHIKGLLKDQVCMISCLLDAFEITQGKRFLENAENLSKLLIETLWDKNNWGFFDKSEYKEDIGELKTRLKPVEENSLAAENFLRLYHLTDNEKYLECAEKTLSIFAKSYENYGYFAANYAISLEKLFLPVNMVVVGGKDILSRNLFTTSIMIFPSLRTVKFLDFLKDKEKIKKAGYPNKPAAYVCAGNLCSRPIYKPEEIEKEIKNIIKPKVVI